MISTEAMTDIDIHIRNARLHHRGDARFDIAIANGRIVAVEPSLDVRAREEIDVGGNLVTTSYVDPHLHLCKVWTLPMMEEAALKAYRGGGMVHTRDAIDLASKVKESYDASWIIPNARRAVALAALYGNLHIRAFADVDNKARLEGVKALLAVREEFRGIVDLQVVAFAQDGLAPTGSCKKPWRSAPTWWAAFPGSKPMTPRAKRTSDSASTSLNNSARTCRCCWTTSATPTCAPWR
jgi:cytosine deaminase